MEIIRHCEKSDIATIKKMYEQQGCFESTTELPFSPLGKWETQFAERPDNYYSLVLETDGEVVGEIAMQASDSPRRKHVATMGMVVNQDFQGRGIGSKLMVALIDLAFNWLSIGRLELEVFVDNESAIHLYKKHGFVIEGTAKAWAFRNNQYVDAYLMAKIAV